LSCSDGSTAIGGAALIHHCRPGGKPELSLVILLPSKYAWGLGLALSEKTQPIFPFGGVPDF